uniref:Uncharacterized protein n=1 Tax=Haplochromis burtoni TaxID=8153 RepID=A0A3Q2VCN9_HAPBU
MHRKEDQRPTREDKKDKRNNIVIPYVTVLSEKLRRVFSKHDITVYFRPSNTLRQKLVHPKHKTPKHNLNNVVYAVQCSEKCLDLYIGEIKQPLHKRMSQHRRATSRLSCPSASKGQRPLLRGHHERSHLCPLSKVRSENLLKSKRPQGKLKARPETLIVVDSAVKDVQRMCGKNTKVLCFPKDMVNNLKERILQIADEYPTVTNIVLHTGSNDVSKQQTKVLKPDFTGLLNTVNSLNAAVFISGPCQVYIVDCHLCLEISTHICLEFYNQCHVGRGLILSSLWRLCVPPRSLWHAHTT